MEGGGTGALEAERGPDWDTEAATYREGKQGTWLCEGAQVLLTALGGSGKGGGFRNGSRSWGLKELGSPGRGKTASTRGRLLQRRSRR